jgi:alpha-L-rhamnosidase
MSSRLHRGIWTLLIVCSGVSLAAAGDLKVTYLRCEHMVDPQGIDVPQPRLSWQLESARRGDRQTAYQVQVASDPARFEQPDLWDSGRVESDASAYIGYAGKPLGSGTRCFWRVRVWDAAGEATAWTKPACWSMGLLEPTLWKAAWIGRDEPAQPVVNPLAQANWIWHGSPSANCVYPAGRRWFRIRLDVPTDRRVVRARAYFAADNAHQVFLNGEHIDNGCSFQTAQEVDLLEAIRPGKNLLALECDNAGDGPNPAGLIGAVVVEFDSGEPLRLVTDAAWKSTDQKQEGWQKPELDDSGWTKAHRLAACGGEGIPWGKVEIGGNAQAIPARMLRHEFALSGNVRRATVYLSGLGYSELYLNGSKVGDHVLDPILTDYDKRVPYVTYEVTEQLKAGKNAIGVWLGNGRYLAPRPNARTFGYPKMRLQLDVELADGTRQTILSDPSWKLTTAGPIRENNDYDGEVYDARMEQPGWCQPGFDDKSWEPAQAVAGPAGVPSAPMMPSMRVTETLKPIARTNPKPGVWIFDMGQNLVGWCRLKVQGPRGTQVRLRHAETLTPDGLLYVANLRSAKARDLYTLKGEGVETYAPRFTYHGFRFVEITGYPGTPELSDLEGQAVHTDLPATGTFACSNPLVNQLHHNIHWGLQDNYLSIPTDCPQRDERQGWQGDRAGECQGETFFFDNLTLYRKWMVDIEDSQRPDGNLSDVAPNYWQLYDPNVTWPSAFTIIPNTLYEQFGERRSIERHYESMKRWMSFLAQFLHDDLIEKDNYGDWCVPPEEPSLIHSKDPARKTSKVVLATCYYYWNRQLLARYATMLDRPDEAKEHLAKAEGVKAAFNKKFFDADRCLYDNGTQTSCLLPLAFGLAPAESRDKLFANLVENITVKTQGHIGTGLIGGQWLMHTLSDHGRADLAYQLLSNKTYPSWGYMVEKGATTVWELWNGDTADPAMNSGNHVMLVGDMAAWLYQRLAGIQSDPEAPGFRRIVMKPHPVGDLSSVTAEYRSIRGPIRSAWKIADGAFRWSITIPANTTATIYVPARDGKAITEGGKPAGEAPGVHFLRDEPGAAVYTIESGQYEFVSPQFTAR